MEDCLKRDNSSNFETNGRNNKTKQKKITPKEKQKSALTFNCILTFLPFLYRDHVQIREEQLAAVL